MNERTRTLTLVLLFSLLPPLLSCGWSVVSAALTYNGTCPGIMDIEPYPCTMGEFIERNTISVFALAAHIAFTVGWLALAALLLGGYFLARRLRGRAAPDL